MDCCIPCPHEELRADWCGMKLATLSKESVAGTAQADAGARITPAAKTHQLNIWSYPEAKRGTSQADADSMEIDTLFWQLAANPQPGKARPEIRDGYRSIPVKDHVVFCTVTSNENSVSSIGVWIARLGVGLALPGQRRHENVFRPGYLGQVQLGQSVDDVSDGGWLRYFDIVCSVFAFVLRHILSIYIDAIGADILCRHIGVYRIGRRG